jgi:arylsulfate sulfotransferase
MQFTIKLKGFLRITVFFIVIASAIAFVSYRAWKYYAYQEILKKTAAKRVKNFEPKAFEYKIAVSDTSQKGYLLFAPAVRFNPKYGRLIIMDTRGEILLERESQGAIVDFRQWNVSGRTLYSYSIEDSAAHHITLSTGHIVILDSAMNELKRVHLLPYKDITVNKREDLDLHDFILFSDDHYITMATYSKQANNIPVFLTPAPGCKVATTIIQEVKNGVVTWQWDGSNYPELYVNSEVGNKFYDTSAAQDYMHINSMTVDPADSNLIISLRQLNQILKIDRHTGDIIWRLGGRNSDFPLLADQVFLRQHNATLTDDGSLLIFDNGEKAQRPFSRILEFKLDEKKKIVSSFRSYRIQEPLTETQGSVQKMGDDYLICGGSANYVLLVNSITGERKMRLVANQSMYRAYLVDNIKGIMQNKAGK